MADDPRPFGLVHGRLNVSVGDTSDAGRAPDRVVVSSGTAVFSANVDMIITNTPGLESVDFPTKISAPINNGALQWGNPAVDDVPLTANVDSTGKSLGWQWTVTLQGMRYSDPTTGQLVSLPAKSWPMDVKPYVPSYIDPVTGTNTTVTQLTAQAPATSPSAVLLAKGDPGPAPTLISRNNTTTTDPAAAGTTFVPTGVAGQYWVDTVQLVGAGGGGGGSGTVTKVNGVFPDGAGAVTLTPANIGAPTVQDNTTAQADRVERVDHGDERADRGERCPDRREQRPVRRSRRKRTRAGPLWRRRTRRRSRVTRKRRPLPQRQRHVASRRLRSCARDRHVRARRRVGTANMVYWNATTQTWTERCHAPSARP
jgi:hypothetical protein